MIGHAVLNHWHPMIGGDFHKPWPPGPPPTPKELDAPVPFFTFSLMIGFLALESEYASSHWTMYGMTMLAPTNIGVMIPHIGIPSLNTPIDIITSSSKSLFGSSRYLIGDKKAAAALFGNTNPNLNCGTPISTPTGCVLAVNTHYVGMTWGDFLAGILSMLADMFAEAAWEKVSKTKAMGAVKEFVKRKVITKIPLSNKAIGLVKKGTEALEGKLGNFDKRVAGKLFKELGEEAGAKTAKGLREKATEIVGDKAGGAVKDWAAKKGYKSPEWLTKDPDYWSREAGTALDKYLNGPGPEDIEGSSGEASAPHDSPPTVDLDEGTSNPDAADSAQYFGADNTDSDGKSTGNASPIDPGAGTPESGGPGDVPSFFGSDEDVPESDTPDESSLVDLGDDAPSASPGDGVRYFGQDDEPLDFGP